MPVIDQPTLEVAIIGGGLTGSICALLLARQGLRVAVVDPFEIYPSDFRCEKLTNGQIERARTLGIDAPLLGAATPVTETIVARGGRPVDLRAVNEGCQRYNTMVNAVRAAWPASIAFHKGRADDIAATPNLQAVTLTSGVQLSARLVILATGPGEKLRARLALTRRIFRDNHSICIGFDLVDGTGGPLSNRALTYYGERAGDGVAFVTVFPFGDRTRCNLFCYLDPASPPIKAVRSNPLVGLNALFPGLISVLGRDVRVEGRPEIRVTDLYEIDEPERDGVVLAGEAFRPSCPVTGTGVTRVLNDTARLCEVHIPRWLETHGMSAAKIASFYTDPAKCAVDHASALDAENQRHFALDRSLETRARRVLALAKSQLHFAGLMKPRSALSLHPVPTAPRRYSAAAGLLETPVAAGRGLPRIANPRMTV